MSYITSANAILLLALIVFIALLIPIGKLLRKKPQKNVESYYQPEVCAHFNPPTTKEKNGNKRKS